MFGTVTGLIPTGAGTSLVSTVTSQISADMPELLIIFGGLFAVGVVLHLVRKWAKLRG